MLNPADVLGAIGSNNRATAGEQFELDTIPNNQNNLTAHDSDPCYMEPAIVSFGESGTRPVSPYFEQHLENDDLQARIAHSPSPLQRYLDTQYLFCQCPHSFGYQAPRGLRFLQNIVFMLLTALACIGTLAHMRSSAVLFTKAKDGIHQYSELGYFVADLLTRLYFIVMLLISKRKISNILDCLEQLDMSTPEKELTQVGHSSNPVGFKWIILTGWVPLLGSSLWGFFGFWQLNQWNIQYVLYGQATELVGLFLTGRRGDPAREIELMQNNFLDKSEARWITLGTLGVICEVAKSMENYAIRHFMLSLALSIKKHCDVWKSIIKRPKARPNLQSLEENDREKLERLWIYYFEIRRCSQTINKHFGILMKLVHLSNILVLAYFIAQIVTSEHTTISFCLFLYEVGLILLFSFTASRIANVNDIARTWIKANVVPTSTIQVDGTTLIVLLDDIRQHPIGIGSGSFFIGEGFIQRFFGLLTSLVLYMTDASEQTTETN